MISFGLLAAAIYMFGVWVNPKNQMLENRLFLFGIIVVHGFSCGTALSAFRRGKGFGRMFGAMMLFIDLYVIHSFLTMFSD